jgi:hypothetical protein
MAEPRSNTFKAWLLEQQARKDVVGAFARSAATDLTFPNEASEVRQELRRFGASAQTMEECAQAIREFNLTFFVSAT